MKKAILENIQIASLIKHKVKKVNKEVNKSTKRYFSKTTWIKRLCLYKLSCFNKFFEKSSI